MLKKTSHTAEEDDIVPTFAIRRQICFLWHEALVSCSSIGQPGVLWPPPWPQNPAVTAWVNCSWKWLQIRGTQIQQGVSCTSSSVLPVRYNFPYIQCVIYICKVSLAQAGRVHLAFCSCRLAGLLSRGLLIDDCFGFPLYSTCQCMSQWTLSHLSFCL